MKHISVCLIAALAVTAGVAPSTLAAVVKKHQSLRHHAVHKASSRHTRSTLAHAPEQPMLVHVNTADLQQLQTLKGIGKTKAKQIIDYRQSHGDFSNLEDLKMVKGLNGSFAKHLLQANSARLAL